MGACDNIGCIYEGGGARPEPPQTFLFGEHLRQWVCIEGVFDTTTHTVSYYVTTQDGRLNNRLIVETALHSVAPELDYWNRISLIGNYGGGVIQTPGMYFMIDELAVSTSFIGPPAGFITGTAPTPPRLTAPAIIDVR
jgi:hypothetical protein